MKHKDDHFIIEENAYRGNYVRLFDASGIQHKSLLCNSLMLLRQGRPVENLYIIIRAMRTIFIYKQTQHIDLT